MFSYSATTAPKQHFENASELIQYMQNQRYKMQEVHKVLDYFTSNEIRHVVECHLNRTANITITADNEQINIEISAREFAELAKITIHVLYFYGTITQLVPLISPEVRKIYIHRLDLDKPELLEELASKLHNCTKLFCLSITRELLSHLKWSGLYVSIGNASAQLLQLIPKHVVLLEVSGFDLLPTLMKLLPTFTQIKQITITTIDIVSPSDALIIRDYVKERQIQFKLNNQWF